MWFQIRPDLPDLKAIVQYNGELIDDKQDGVFTWRQILKKGQEQTKTLLEQRIKVKKIWLANSFTSVQLSLDTWYTLEIFIKDFKLDLLPFSVSLEKLFCKSL